MADCLTCQDSSNNEAACLIRLSALRLAVLAYVRAGVAEKPWETGSRFLELRERLQRFTADLAGDMSYSPTQVFHKKRQGLLVSFLTLHVLLEQVKCDLYQTSRLLLDSSDTEWTPPQTYLRLCRQERLKGAIRLCSMLGDACHHQNMAFDPTVGICAFQACKTLIFQRLEEAEEAELAITAVKVQAALSSALTCMRRLAVGSSVVKRFVSRHHYMYRHAHRTRS